MTRRVVVRKEKVKGLREEVEKIVRTTGAVARVWENRKIGSREMKEERRMVWVRFASVAEKLKIMRERMKL